MIIEFAIACRDEADLASGHKRKKEGDVIAFKIRNENYIPWSEHEKATHLIVPLDGITIEEAREMCSGEKGPDGAKNAYRMPFTQLAKHITSFKSKDVRDIKKVYQPFLDLKKVVIFDRTIGSKVEKVIDDKHSGKLINSISFKTSAVEG